MATSMWTSVVLGDFFDTVETVWGNRGILEFRQKGVRMIPKEDTPSPEDTATTILIFEDDDKVQERVVHALQKVFFAHSATTAAIARGNCEALFRALVRSQTGQSEEFRKLCVQHLDLQVREHVRDVIRAEFQTAVDAAVARQIGTLEKLAKQVRAIPKGPRR